MTYRVWFNISTMCPTNQQHCWRQPLSHHDWPDVRNWSVTPLSYVLIRDAHCMLFVHYLILTRIKHGAVLCTRLACLDYSLDSTLAEDWIELGWKDETWLSFSDRISTTAHCNNVSLSWCTFVNSMQRILKYLLHSTSKHFMPLTCLLHLKDAHEEIWFKHILLARKHHSVPNL